MTPDLLQVAEATLPGRRSDARPGAFSEPGIKHVGTVRPRIPGVIINRKVCMRPVTQSRG